MAAEANTMEKIVALCKRRGFIFQSSEIYGGIGGFWDYGPLGTELKRNIKDAWWQDMVRNPPPGPDGQDIQMVGVDCSIIMNPKVWEASGHVGGFQDPMLACKAEGCKRLFRADKVFDVVVLQVDKDAPEWRRKGKNPEDAIKRLEKEHEEPGQFEGETFVSYCGREMGENVRVYFVDERSDEHGEFRVWFSVEMPKPIKRKMIEADSPRDAVQKFYSDRKSRKFLDSLNFRPLIVARQAIDKRIGYPYADIWTANFDENAYKVHSAPFCCPDCGGELTEPRQFNLMFQTHVGALQDAASVAYLRPETAQGIFANFKNVMDSTRVKMPFGIAQIGKAFRNEINPRNYTFRSREFEQMEIEFFCHPNESQQWYEYWRDVRLGWYESLGIKSDKLRPREQTEDERAHYSSACIDIEYLFPFSDEPQELEGVAHRGCYDLSAHGKHAKGKETAFAVMDDATKERFVPHVIEPSAGVDRFALATITEAYTVDENRASPEFMRFHPRLAPVKAAVFPLVAKDGLPEIAEPIFRAIKQQFPAQFDAKQSIGKRYARMDEAGTPFCFTIDSQTKEDDTVTVRSRDDASQQRIPKAGCLAYLRDQLGL
jgi:glycyl-tRNA synthetase (class II)